MRTGMSTKAGNFIGDCYKLQKYRDTLILASTSEDDSATSSTDATSESDSGDDRRLIKPGPNDIKKREKETLEKNKLVARRLVERAKTDKGLEGLWAFYDNKADRNGEIPVKNNDLRDMYYMFIDTCVVNMITRASWKSNHDTEDMSKYISVSDEAFAMLILENIAGNLIPEGTGQGDGVTGTRRMIGCKHTTKYTKGGKDDRDDEGKMRGWRRKGVTRFNELCKDVMVRRGITSISKQLEKDLRQRYQKDKLAEEEAEGELEKVDEHSGSRKRNFVQGYDMSIMKMPKLEKTDLNIPEDYKHFVFDISKSVAL